MKHLSKSFLVLLIFIGPIILLCGCKKEIEKTLLSLSITKHPEGGKNINKETAEITGNIFGPVKDIEVLIQWLWVDGNLENETIVSVDTVVFNSNEIKTISTEVFACYMMLNYYWIEASWFDDDSFHKIESGKAYYVGGY